MVFTGSFALPHATELGAGRRLEHRDFPALPTQTGETTSETKLRGACDYPERLRRK
jgi:hypothetical protein